VSAFHGPPLVLCDCPMGPGKRCGAWACARFGCDCPPPKGAWCEHYHVEFALHPASEVQQKTLETEGTGGVS